MIPTYFPFTYIPNDIAETIYSCFNTCVLYLPSKQHVSDSMNTLENKNMVDLHFPIKGDENIIGSMIKEFNLWEDFLTDHGKDIIKTRLNTIPFYDESSPSQIRSDIKNRLDKKKINQENILLNSRIFLHFAQELDKKNYELNKEMSLLEKKQHHLFQNIIQITRGEEKTNDVRRTDHVYDYMIIQRLKAWIHLSLNDLNPSSFFLTHSRQLIDYLIQSFPEMKKDVCTNITSFNNKNQILTHIESLAKNEQNSEPVTLTLDSYKKNTELVLYMVPHKTPHDFFSCIIGGKNIIQDKNNPTNPYKNTVIGLIDFNT
jgi:hypothetical protein